MNDINRLENLCRLVRYFILVSTTEAGSGHPTSSLSAVELMTSLFFGGAFQFDPDNPSFPNNDRLIFSKGHAAPLLYALWAAAGKVTEQELKTLRKFGSPLEGHPTRAFPFAEASTGSLGQGLSVGLGMAMNAKFVDKLPYRTFVLLGDSEMSEGSQWEAIQIASHYRLDNLTGILDVNRLGQRGETMYGHDLDAYQKRISSFGWETVLVDGHSIEEILAAYETAGKVRQRPVMIIARTVKGKGVSILEDQDNWHGKALKREEYEEAVKELGTVDASLTGVISRPENVEPDTTYNKKIHQVSYPVKKMLATRKAYGQALADIFREFPDIVVLDAEVSNSTFSEIFEREYPERFFEMYVAEQNMVGAALGFSCRNKIPFISTFAAFFSRAFDQIRMCQYSDANIKFAGSHAGVSIGEDGPSQMGLEDIAMFRALLNSVVLYPSDALSTARLVREAARHRGVVYLRTTRNESPVIYGPEDAFQIGGSKVIRRSPEDKLTVIAAGVTLHEALAAYEVLKDKGIMIRVIDLYSIKPIDRQTLLEAADETSAIMTVEDHYAEGGIGEAVMAALSDAEIKIHSLAVQKMPCSGKTAELLDYEGISSAAIVRKALELTGRGGL